MLWSLLGSQAKSFEVGCQTSSVKRLLTLRLLIEVRELVSAKDKLTTLGGESVTFVVGGIDIFLYLACLYHSEETAFVLYAEEEFPCLLSNVGGEFFDVVRASTWVNNSIEMALLFQQQLLIACYTLREIIRGLVGSIKRCHHDGMHSSKGCRHGLGL